MASPDAASTSASPAGERAGHYELFARLGVGTLATAHLGRRLGASGFGVAVVVKRLLPALAHDEAFRRSVLDEARRAADVLHPHVVPTLEVVEDGDDVIIVTEYVHGASLAVLGGGARERGERLPPGVAVSLVAGALRGLQAVHEARDEGGEPLGLVHGDVTPRNVLVGVDGLARLSDVGLGKAGGGANLTGRSEFKGKLTYASPEQLKPDPISPAADLYSMGLVLWELLVGERLYAGLTPLEVAARLITGARLHAPSRRVDGVPPELDAVIERATRPEPSERFESAQAMASALEACASPAPAAYVAAWVRARAAALLDERERLIMATQFPAAPAAALAPGAGVEGEAGSPMTTLVSAQPKPSASFEIALAAPAGRSSSAPPPRASVVPPARSSAPPPRTSVVPPARSSAPPPRTSVVPPPRTSVVPSAPGVGSTLASAGVIPVSPADLGDRGAFAKPFGAAFWSGRWGRRIRSRLGTTLVRVAGVAIGLVFGLLVAKLVLPPAGGAAPAESASPPARLAVPSLATGVVPVGTGVVPVGTGADRAPVETAAPLATEAPAPEASAPAPASPRKKRPLVRGRDEDRAPRRERCSPPYVIDADGVRHPKPGCR